MKRAVFYVISSLAIRIVVFIDGNYLEIIIAHILNSFGCEAMSFGGIVSANEFLTRFMRCFQCGTCTAYGVKTVYNIVGSAGFAVKGNSPQC